MKEETTTQSEIQTDSNGIKMLEDHAPIVMVSAMGRNTRAIGKDNDLLWHVPEDLKRFRAFTLGKPVIMGQKTFESIIDITGKPFPNRTNIVMTLDKDFKCEWPEVKVVYSPEEAVVVAQEEDPEEIHIGGGGMIYKLFLPYASRLHLTFFDDDQEGDTYFPEFADQFEIAEEHPTQEYEGITYQWVDFVRKN